MQPIIDTAMYRGVGRLLTRRETLLAAGSTGVGAAPLGLTILDSCSDKLFLIAMPSVHAGTFWLDMDSQLAPNAHTPSEDTFSVQLQLNVKELLSDRLLPLQRAAIHISTPMCGLAAGKSAAWTSTDKNGDACISWQVNQPAEIINLPLIISVRHYNIFSDLTSVFETAILFTNHTQQLNSEAGRCAIPAGRARFHSPSNICCTANIVLVNRETRTPSIGTLR